MRDVSKAEYQLKPDFDWVLFGAEGITVDRDTTFVPGKTQHLRIISGENVGAEVKLVDFEAQMDEWFDIARFREAV